jgi:hypothetical protein
VPKHKTIRPEVPDCLGSGGVKTDVIAPPPGDLFSETNDNSVAILLSYGPRPLGWRRRGEGGAHGERHEHEALNDYVAAQMQNLLS